MYIIVSLLLIAVPISYLLYKLHRLKASIHNYGTYWKAQASLKGDFTYVVLGDSAAQGVGASRPELGYVGLIASHINDTTGKSVRVVNLSVSGARVQDVLNKQIPLLKNFRPDVITLEVGGNDVANNYDPAQFEKQYSKLAQALPAGTLVANIPYFGGRIRKNSAAINANKAIEAMVRKYNLTLVDLQKETRLKQSILNYTSDMFHPSNRGYRIWAAAFWSVVRKRLE